MGKWAKSDLSDFDNDLDGTSYDQSLYELHIVSHIWPFSLSDQI